MFTARGWRKPRKNTQNEQRNVFSHGASPFLRYPEQSRARDCGIQAISFARCSDRTLRYQGRKISCKAGSSGPQARARGESNPVVLTAAAMVALHLAGAQPMLPGIASLALPVPTPAPPCAAAGQASPPLLPPALEPAAKWGPLRAAGSVLPAVAAPPWQSQGSLGAHLVLQEPLVGQQTAQSRTAGSQTPETNSTVLVSMLRQLQQQQQHLQQQQMQHELHLQQHSGALLMLHHPRLQHPDFSSRTRPQTAPDLVLSPPVQKSLVSLPIHMNHSNEPARPASVSTGHQSANTGCSSRSSPPTAGGASQGSPDRESQASLSTLLACNEVLKSQLKENEMRIERHSKSRADHDDADSNDGADSDIGSSNGASSASNASTTPSIKEPSVSQSRYWTEEEHRKFLEAVRCFGAHNHKAIASYVTTRNSTQVRSHSQKFFKKLETFRGRGLPTMLRKRKQPASK